MKSNGLRNMAAGKKYEEKVQDLLEKYSMGKVHRNVRVGSFCEFDAVIEDYPLITFIEIKRYRADFVPDRVRMAVTKLRAHCSKIVYTGRKFDRTWYPHSNNISEDETLFELLLKKMDIEQIEGWRFSMVLIVPNAAYKRVIESLAGRNQRTPTRNMINIDGIPLIVVRETAINTTFG